MQYMAVAGIVIPHTEHFFCFTLGSVTLLILTLLTRSYFYVRTTDVLLITGELCGYTSARILYPHFVGCQAQSRRHLSGFGRAGVATGHLGSFIERSFYLLASDAGTQKYGPLGHSIL